MMGALFYLLALGLLAYLVILNKHHHSSAPMATTVFVNGTAPIAEVDEDFICATLDWGPPGGTTSLLDLDVSNGILHNAVKAFSPLKIRLGGTLQDNVIYQTDHNQPCQYFKQNLSHVFQFNQGCLPMSRWDELNAFFNQTGAVVTFGLNALTGRRINSSQSADGDWDSTNAESLLRYTVNKGFPILGWELGNELSGTGIGARVTADQYAEDVSTLQGLIDDIYSGFGRKPLLIAPGGYFDQSWFAHFVDKATNSVQVVTHHIYNLGSGQENDLEQKMLDPTYLNSEATVFESLHSIINNSRTSAVAWVGEAGGAYNGGRDLVTNAFIMNFWYLDQLGMASSYNTKTYCRQTLIGEHYGLLNTTSFIPNPDYYSALLWHRLMGKHVLSTASIETAKLRAYAHCSKQSKGFAMLLLNLDRGREVEVSLSTENGLITSQSEDKGYSLKSGRKVQRGSFAGTVPNIEITFREEYHLTAQNGDLHSQTVLLNGKVLNVSSEGEIPPLEPGIVNLFEPVIVAPYSVVFIHIPSIVLPACR